MDDHEEKMSRKGEDGALGRLTSSRFAHTNPW
jgi:hypothetical protein